MRSSSQWVLLSALALSGAVAVGGTGCVGEIGAVDTAPPDADALGVAEVGLRRLTTHEIDNLLEHVFGDTTRPASRLLPEDFRTPFDNAYEGQQISQVLISGAETMAADVAQRFAAAPGDFLGCTATGPDDRECLETFVRTAGRLAWRRSLTDAEVDDLVALGTGLAIEAGDFSVGVEVVVRALVQSPQLLYRLEIGTEVAPHLVTLTGPEVASRISFLLWGSAPDARLLDLAEAGALASPDGRREVAMTMLEDARARRQLERFHAMWLGYEQLPHAPDISTRMRQESAALVERVVFEDRNWLSLFTSGETFADDTLLSHYGLPPVGASTPRWVDVSGTGREGLLGHGSFLSAAANPGDTSPTKRGVLIRERLMCRPVPPPPPNVPADQPPEEELGACKSDQYEAHRQDPACAGCHSLMDPVGWGLERFDRAGVYRTHDDGHPECAVDGAGELTGIGTFSGPAELSQRLLEADVLDACAVEHLYQFALGRELDARDEPVLEAALAAFEAHDHRFSALVIAIVTHPSFTLRLSPSEN